MRHSPSDYRDLRIRGELGFKGYGDWSGVDGSNAGLVCVKVLNYTNRLRGRTTTAITHLLGRAQAWSPRLGGGALAPRSERAPLGTTLLAGHIEKMNTFI